MMNVPPLADARAKLSVMMNGILVATNRVPKNLGRFCRPLSFRNAHPVHDLSMAGSAFLARIRGKNLVFATQHQRGDLSSERRGEDIVLIENDGEQSVGISPNQFISVWTTPDSEPIREDFLVLQYDDVREGRDLRRRFLSLDTSDFIEPDELPEGSNIHAILVVGFPTNQTDYTTEIDEETYEEQPPKIHSRQSVFFLRLASRSDLDDQKLTPYVLDERHHEGEIEPDGLSGAPLMMIAQQPNGQARLYFVGIAVKGSKVGRFNVLGSKRLRELLSAGLLDLVPHSDHVGRFG